MDGIYPQDAAFNEGFCTQVLLLRGPGPKGTQGMKRFPRAPGLEPPAVEMDQSAVGEQQVTSIKFRV